jgi:hypothetical protein
VPSTPSLLPMILQQALQKANPQPLPSNTVITVIAGPYGGADVGDAPATAVYTEANFVWGGPSTDPGWVWSGGAWQ